MKKIAVMIMVLIISATVSAYEKTLLTGDIENGGYGGPVIQWSTVDGKDAVFVGGRGGWIINHSFSIGGAGYGLVTPVKYTDGNGDIKKLDIGYGGVMLQFIGNSDEVVHFNIDLLFAAGGIGFSNNDVFNDSNEEDWKYDDFYVIQPEVDLVMNIAPFFRISAGGGYRFTYDLDLTDETRNIHLSNDDLKGPTAKLAFNFGLF